MDGLDAMLENGPWFIQNNPLILKKWHTDENLLKEDVSTIPVWVKLHGVPVTTFSKDGLSDIATKLDTPLMLDSYTSLKDNIVMAMPKITREGHYICNVRVEYEWKPPRCVLERISKKRTKNEVKTTKPDSKWKSKEKIKSKSKPKPEKSTQVNPDKSKSQHVKKNKFKG
ncbi:copia protein [Tanacetum coccineum]